jgi:hypothetical protein
MLWQNGKLCQQLHEYFIDQAQATWLPKTREITPAIRSHPCGDRISINFFAIRSEDLDMYQKVGGTDDEASITITLPRQLQRKHGIDMAFTVGHLGFYKQRETGLNEAAVLKKYNELADTFLAD